MWHGTRDALGSIVAISGRQTDLLLHMHSLVYTSSPEVYCGLSAAEVGVLSYWLLQVLLLLQHVWWRYLAPKLS